jgi:hypothetical protein
MSKRVYHVIAKISLDYDDVLVRDESWCGFGDREIIIERMSIHFLCDCKRVVRNSREDVRREDDHV